MIKAWACVSQLRCIRSDTKSQEVCLRWQPVVMSLLFGLFVFFRASRGSGLRNADIPQTSQQSLKFPPFVSSPLSDRCLCPLSFLPLLSLLARVNLHHMFFNRDGGVCLGGAVVEACEPDTTVNLYFHSVTPSRPSSSSFSPFLSYSFFYWHVTHWTSWKLHWAEKWMFGEGGRGGIHTSEVIGDGECRRRPGGGV